MAEDRLSGAPAWAASPVAGSSAGVQSSLGPLGCGEPGGGMHRPFSLPGPELDGNFETLVH